MDAKIVITIKCNISNGIKYIEKILNELNESDEIVSVDYVDNKNIFQALSNMIGIQKQPNNKIDNHD